MSKTREGTMTVEYPFSDNAKWWHRKNKIFKVQMIGDLVSKETVCCVGGKVKHKNRLSTTRSIR